MSSSSRSSGVYVENWWLPDGSRPVTAIGPDGRLQAFYAMQPEDDEPTVKRCMERLLAMRHRQGHPAHGGGLKLLDGGGANE